MSLHSNALLDVHISQSSLALMDPSHMDLSHTPFLKPPPGVVPEFVDPVSQAPTVIVINVVWITLMLCFVVMRIYTKGRILRNLGWDDCKPFSLPDSSQSRLADRSQILVCWQQ